jgi:N-methylhydantoinase A
MYCPTLDLVSIGAGGGSIARVDPVKRRLQVGPDSAGAQPGPACYGRGGVLPTTTDANLVLGYMAADRFLGGRFKLDVEAARRALRIHVAEPLGIGIEDAAAAVFAIVNAKMADLVRKVSVERGHDPRDFVVCAYGGLGPLHAPFYSADLNARAVLVPLGELSSVFSAYGIAMADILHVHELSCTLREPLHAADIDQAFTRVTDAAHRQLAADGIGAEDREMRRFMEVRYVGQLNELLVESRFDGEAAFDVRREFERRYGEAFGPGAVWSDAPIEIVGLRLEAVGKRRHFPRVQLPPSATELPLCGRRSVYWPEPKGFQSTGIYDGSSVLPGHTVEGPAVLEFATTTVVVPPGWRCVVDPFGNLMLHTPDATGARR